MDAISIEDLVYEISSRFDASITPSEVRSLVGSKELGSFNFDDLFEQLKHQTKEIANDSDKYNESVLLQSQYNEWKKNTEMNLIDTKDAQITLNRISIAIVGLIDEL